LIQAASAALTELLGLELTLGLGVGIVAVELGERACAAPHAQSRPLMARNPAHSPKLRRSTTAG
jgi:hypothetical protein